MKNTHDNHRNFSITSLALAAALLLGACSSVPNSNTALVNARAAFDSAQNNPQTRELAAADLAVASTALNRADEAFKRGDSLAEVDHLAYLASQRVGIAQQTAKQKAADAQLVSAEAERDRTRLAARTNEADAATAQAQRSQQLAQASQQAAAASQQDAQAAQRTAQASRLQSEAAMRAAQTAQAQSAQAQAQSTQSQMQTAEAQARSAQLEEQMRALNAKKTERGMVVTIGDVLFDTGRAELKPGSARDMSKLAEFFKAYPQRTALVEGFTDSVGGTSANQDLSDRRAAAVRTALVDMGVARDRINTRGYGEAFPAAGNDNASGRQMNRRVEIVLSDDSGQIKPR
jgi:outer membrane protein OmpA-like peptidoglycan-associated protein